MIQVVVSCTERKSAPANPSLSVAALAHDTFDDRLAGWLRALGAAPRTTAAADLYRGEHWAVARSMITAGRVKVRVASAGYGLVSADTLLAPYSATFAPGLADSVATIGDPMSLDAQRVKWWQSVQEQNRSFTTTFGALASQGPLVIAASRPYLAAMAPEILVAAAGHPGRVVIASVSEPPASLAHLRPPATGRLRTVLGGSMQALNGRLARALVDEVDENCLSLQSAAAFTARLLSDAPPLEQFNRKTLSDDEVVGFIRAKAERLSATSHSALLRLLRDEGMACEQSRFRRLYGLAVGNDERAH